MSTGSTPSNTTARSALANLILSKCSGGRGRPPAHSSTLRTVAKASVEASATDEADFKENSVSKNETNVLDKENEINNMVEEKEAGNIKRELLETIQLLNNARGSLELLKEIYAKRNQEKVDGMETLSFSSMKKLYGEKIVEYGGLAEKHRKIKTEVKGFHKSNANMRWELDQMRGSRVQENPWQVGVPYGYHGNARREGGRDGTRRDGEGRRDKSRARR